MPGMSRLPRSLFLIGAFGAGLAFLQCGGGSDRTFTDDVDGGEVPPPFTPGLGDGAADAPKPVIDKCKVPVDELNGGGLECTKSAPPNSFKPVTKWTWTEPMPAPSSQQGSIVTPLVGNFTDDNGDGKVDLCDTPDVLITVWNPGSIYMLAGNDGRVEAVIDNIDGNITPAFGDLDNDGVPEIVANDRQGHVVVYDNLGKLKWTGPDVGKYKANFNSYCHAIAIYDLDGDGTPEIIAGFEVFDAKGKSKFFHDVTSFQGSYWCPANTAADLDGDGKLEVIFGNSAYHADGSVYWTIPGPPGQPQVANLDADPQPEIFVARNDGILVLEHDGKIKYGPINLTGEATSANCWSKPGAVTDFDGDGIADISASTCTKYGAYKVGLTGLSLIWSAPVDDNSGLASSTAFDFLGGGTAQAVYGDQSKLYVFDGKTGQVRLNASRASGTLIEYPVVADVDNDQSADIIVVSNGNGGVGTYKHTVEVLQDETKRWIPTRRVWNQHAYHVTNVREDGTIPKVMAKSWQRLNTFRVNAQIEGGGDCAPPPSNPPK